MAAAAVSEVVRTSLGPASRDKLIVRSNGEVVITNDGFKLLQEMKIQHPIGRLLVHLSKGQDEKIGDGTTSVVVLAGSLLSSSLPLIERGLHPSLIIQGFTTALELSLQHLEAISLSIQCPPLSSNHTDLIKLASTCLNSKFVSRDKERLAKMCVDAGMCD